MFVTFNFAFNPVFSLQHSKYREKNISWVLFYLTKNCGLCILMCPSEQPYPITYNHLIQCNGNRSWLAAMKIECIVHIGNKKLKFMNYSSSIRDYDSFNARSIMWNGSIFMNLKIHILWIKDFQNQSSPWKWRKGPKCERVNFSFKNPSLKCIIL